MTVKEKIGRRRYIAFEIEADERISKGDLIHVIRRVAMNKKIGREMKPFVIRYDNNRGLLRCQHRWKDEGIKLLTSIEYIKENPVKIKTLGTSGTIKACLKKYFGGNKVNI